MVVAKPSTTPNGQTINKLVHVDLDDVEWNGRIVLQTELSNKVRFKVYASFELGSMLGHGNLLRIFEISVTELLDRTLVFLPKSGEIVSTYTSLFIQSLSRGTDVGVLCISTPSDMQPVDHPDRFLTSNNLADALVARLEHRGNDKHLDEVIPPHGVVLALHPVEHPDNDHDLEEALAITHSTLSLMMTHHPRRSIDHGSLANIYLLIHQSRLHTTGKDADSLNAAMSHFKASVDIVSSGLLYRLIMGLRWIHNADQCMHSALLDDYANSTQLLDAFMSTIASLWELWVDDLDRFA
ncbi:hypothetical protein AZE42_07014 [Rhizopogon vesiculosus]|uniref:Uncharacterized protein n=1 Tax=Rhizopogon vesiculosus TaxID=180088 RepID=A0A1J8QGF3_9AGAM|nr:hypothetical protein AZE42_07014 [Rhizopogon vesiculosus]